MGGLFVLTIILVLMNLIPVIYFERWGGFSGKEVFDKDCPNWERLMYLYLVITFISYIVIVFFFPEIWDTTTIRSVF